MKLVLQYIDDCPSWETARTNLVAAAKALGVDADITLTKVASDDEAQRVAFHGSPSILVGGEDLFPAAESVIGMSCRLYSVEGTQAGAPSVGQLVDALRQFAR